MPEMRDHPPDWVVKDLHKAMGEMRRPSTTSYTSDWIRLDNPVTQQHKKVTNMSEEISMSDLHEQTTEDLFKAAAEEGLVYSGSYITKGRTIKQVRIDEDAEYSAGRELAYIKLRFFDEDGTTPQGDALLTVSWEPRFYETGRGERRLDRLAKAYKDLARAVSKGRPTVGAVLEDVAKFAFMTRVREVYVVSPDDLHDDHLELVRENDPSANVWITLERDDDDPREHYLSLGYEPRTQIDRIWAIK